MAAKKTAAKKESARTTSAKRKTTAKKTATKPSSSPAVVGGVSAEHRAAFAALKAAALAFPVAWEDHPWGETAIKVQTKVFAFMFGGVHPSTTKHLSVGLKLPNSAASILALPFAAPTGYGLGKSGWVTFGSGATDVVPVDLLVPLIQESYVAVAPATHAKAVSPSSSPSISAPKKPRRRP